jgi:hypothetical protein
MKTFNEFAVNLNENLGAAAVKSVIDYRDGLVSVGNILVTSLNRIKFDHPNKPHDLNALTKIEDTLKTLTKQIQMFPELRSTIKGRIRFPNRPKRQQRSGP